MRNSTVGNSRRKSLPEMSRADKEKVDGLMWEYHNSIRSPITEHDWKEVSNGVWVCAYCKNPARDDEVPELYFVHFAVEYRVAVVYKSLPIPWRNL